MCKGGDTTSTSKVDLPKYLEGAYKNLLNLGTNVAKQPLQQYTGPQVAGFTPDQQRAFQMTSEAAGLQTPYLNTAADWLGESSQALFPQIPQYSSENLQPYMDPYQQDVIDATMANIARSDAVAQNQLRGQGILAGASPFQSDRAGVAAAELARGQGLSRNQTIADLTSRGFQNAQQQLANQQNLQLAGMGADAQRQMAAAGQMAGLGSQAQTGALQGAQSLLQSGALQQENAQQQLNIPYQQFLQQQQHPYDMTNFLSNLVFGIGNQTPRTTTTTQPGPSPISQIAGLGLGALGGIFGGPAGAAAGAGLYSGTQGFGTGFYDRGGRVPKMATGGVLPDVWLSPTEEGAPQLNPSQFMVPWSGAGQDWGPGPLPGQPYYMNALPQVQNQWAPRVTPYSSDVQSAFDLMSKDIDKELAKDKDKDKNKEEKKSKRFWFSSSGGAVKKQGGGFLSGLGERLNNPLVYMGLGMMSGESPHALSNIGAGGLAGMQAYKQANPALDQDAQILDDGETYRIFYPGTGEIVDTGMPITGDPEMRELDPNKVYQTRTDEGWETIDIPPPAADPTALEKQVEAAGFTPGTPEYQAKMNELLAKSGVNIDMKGESKWDEESAKKLVEASWEVFQNAENAQEALSNYETLGVLLGDPDVYTGTAGGAIASLKKAGSTLFGMDFEGVAEADVANKVASQLLGQIRKDIMTGATSDRDIAFLREIPPGLGDDPESVQLTVEMARRSAEAAAAKRDKLAEIISRDPEQRLSMAGWLEFQSWVQANPVFTPDIIQKVREVAEARTVKRGPSAGSEDAIRRMEQQFGLEPVQ